MGDRYRVEGVRLPVGEPSTDELRRAAASAIHMEAEEIISCRVLRRSLDARRERVSFVFNLELEISPGCSLVGERDGVVKVSPAPPPGIARPLLAAPDRRPRTVVVGAGPAGLFAALTLLLNGVSVILLERGRAVEERLRHVDVFWRRGILRKDSNVLFGEGGAGTFSDGKLTTRVRNPYGAWVKQVLVEMGAPPSIMIDAKPHIGTDRLRYVVHNLRRRIRSSGGEIRFGTVLTDLVVHRGSVMGVVIDDGEEIAAERIILAIGQGAEDTYRMLHNHGVRMEIKPFALGLRVEHPQELINRIQYGRGGEGKALPPAEYTLAMRTTAGRSLYSFCMCPGGVIIAAGADAGRVVTNGMSRSRRDGYLANSALVVNVTADDVMETDGDHPLAGLAFRRRWEERAFSLGGGGYRAPGQYLLDFIADRETPACGETSYRPGVTAAPLKEVLPPFVTAALRDGLAFFGRKMPGFLSKEAVLVGVETRTSSPVRITRGDNGQSVTIRGLYPCGEGAGYAGGIVSSALDGIRAALKALGG